MSKSELLHDLKSAGAIAVSVAVLALTSYLVINCRDSFTNSSPLEERSVAIVKSGIRQPDKDQNTPHRKTDFIYPEIVHRDPFERQLEGEARKIEVTTGRVQVLPILRGVVWGPEGPLAILESIDQQTHLLKANEMVDSYTVIEIFPGGVLLGGKGHRYELKLWREEIERLRVNSSLR